MNIHVWWILNQADLDYNHQSGRKNPKGRNSFSLQSNGPKGCSCDYKWSRTWCCLFCFISSLTNKLKLETGLWNISETFWWWNERIMLRITANLQAILETFWPFNHNIVYKLLTETDSPHWLLRALKVQYNLSLFLRYNRVWRTMKKKIF